MDPFNPFSPFKFLIFVSIHSIIAFLYLYQFKFTDKQCCAQPDIQLIANVITNEFVLLKWSTSLDETYGFCVLYQCDADDSVNYCQKTEVAT